MNQLLKLQSETDNERQNNVNLTLDAKSEQIRYLRKNLVYLNNRALNNEDCECIELSDEDLDILDLGLRSDSDEDDDGEDLDDENRDVQQENAENQEINRFTEIEERFSGKYRYFVEVSDRINCTKKQFLIYFF